MRATPFLFVLAACSPTEARDRVVFGGTILAVHVEIDAGDVRVDAGGEGVSVARTLRGTAIGAVTQRVEDGILRIEARCEPLLPCGADLAITLPAGLPVDVRTGAGDVRVSGLASDLSIAVGDGDVSAYDLLAATVRVQAGWGDARLSFAAVPADVRVGVGVGDVTLAVPDAGYDVDVESLGTSRVAVARDAAGPRLHVRAASGRATVEHG